MAELNVGNGSLVQIPSGASYGFYAPWAIAVDGTHVWAVDHGGNSVTEFSRRMTRWRGNDCALLPDRQIFDSRTPVVPS